MYFEYDSWRVAWLGIQSQFLDLQLFFKKTKYKQQIVFKLAWKMLKTELYSKCHSETVQMQQQKSWGSFFIGATDFTFYHFVIMKNRKKISILEFHFSAISLRISSSFVWYPYSVISGHLKISFFKKKIFENLKKNLAWAFLVSSWMQKTVLWYHIDTDFSQEDRHFD